jgi:nucleosome binding factor SPN SPT16 subunit
MDRRGMNSYDAGEEREDMMQNQRIASMNAAFKHFCKQVEELTASTPFPLCFDVPFTKLGFAGNPIRSLVNCYPTRDCLVALQEWPAFLLTVKDVEFVCFERYSLQLMEFDMLFCMKNYEKAPIKICAIRRSEIDKIKQWLAELRMVWYHSQVPLNWTKVNKEVIKNIQQNKFIQSGGWDAWFNTEEDVSDHGDSDPESAYETDKESSEEAYQPSEADETESDTMEDSESESGLDWDELEDRAQKADRRKDGRDAPSAPKPPSKRRRR